MLGYKPPVWFSIVHGAFDMESPSVGALPDGTIVATSDVASGSTLVFGQGEPNETSFSDPFQPAIGWFDAADGHLVRALQIGGPVSAQKPGGVAARGLAIAPDGTTFLTGELANHALFFKGTPQAIELDSDQEMNGQNLDLAYDPFALTIAKDGTPGWIARGRTPAPIAFTWFNYATGVSVAPNGEAFTVGVTDGPGLVVGDGKPGATTLANGPGSYFARYAADGHLLWVVPNLGDFRAWAGIRATPGGGAIVAGFALSQVTFAAGRADETVIAMAPNLVTFAVVALDAQGTIAWTRTFTAPSTSDLGGYAIDAQGGVVVGGSFRPGAATFLDAKGQAAAMLAPKTAQGYLARWASDGTFSWAKLLGDGIDIATSVTLDASNVVRVHVGVAPGTMAIPLDPGQAALPILTGEGDVVLTLDAAGARTKATLIGQDLGLERAWATPDGALAFAGFLWPMTAPTIGGPNGPDPLPPPSAMEGGQTIVLKIAP